MAVAMEQGTSTFVHLTTSLDQGLPVAYRVMQDGQIQPGCWYVERNEVWIEWKGDDVKVSRYAKEGWHVLREVALNPVVNLAVQNLVSK